MKLFAIHFNVNTKDDYFTVNVMIVRADNDSEARQMVSDIPLVSGLTVDILHVLELNPAGEKGMVQSYTVDHPEPYRSKINELES